MKILLIDEKVTTMQILPCMTRKSFTQGSICYIKPNQKTPTLCLFFTGNCPIKPPCCLCGHIIRSSCFIGYYYKAFQAFFCNHIIQFHDHFLLITQKINFVFFETNNVGKLHKNLSFFCYTFAVN